jgi:hypothetical protein
MPAITGWENFYVIVGSSAGALIGLQFVVITLVSTMPIKEGGEQATSAFATPTIIHFSSVLLLSGILSAPWRRVETAAVVWGALGLGGIVYEIIVARRMRTQALYTPELEDWVFHLLFPLAAYGTLAGSAYAARLHARAALFSVGAAALMLLFVGIHNAWDAITYHVFARRQAHHQPEPRPSEKVIDDTKP